MNNDFNNFNGTYTQEQPQKQEPSKGEAIKAMVFGIIAAYLAWLPFFSVVGIIFGIIACKNGTKIMSAEPSSRATYNFAKAGKITGKVGLIGGIVMTAFWILYFVIIFAAVATILG